jgi:hypothetical protein
VRRVSRGNAENGGTMTTMQHSIPEDDWVAAEAEALLAADPELRADLRRAAAEHRAGTLKTVDTATVRAAIEARIAKRDSH